MVLSPHKLSQRHGTPRRPKAWPKVTEFQNQTEKGGRIGNVASNKAGITLNIPLSFW
jgi:hypothetical protein